jgi:hypothetical protein
MHLWGTDGIEERQMTVFVQKKHFLQVMGMAGWMLLFAT